MQQLSRQNISRQIIGRNFSEPEQSPFEKKIGPGQIRTHNICRSRRIRYHQAKRAR